MREENLRGYFAAISAMDEQIGRLLDAVEEQGLADNTVILFTADNGMSMDIKYPNYSPNGQLHKYQTSFLLL